MRLQTPGSTYSDFSGCLPVNNSIHPNRRMRILRYDGLAGEERRLSPYADCFKVESNASALQSSPILHGDVPNGAPPNAGVLAADDPSGPGSRRSGRLRSGD